MCEDIQWRVPRESGSKNSREQVDRSVDGRCISMSTRDVLHNLCYDILHAICRSKKLFSVVKLSGCGH